ncbi:SPOSA6832_01438 [Sporobolomyces salmonicolor]|uniref:SPOSA6832_01438-mRNA-1:cds n=1 Tax=Sporidiobolus salmonicolor TaxID=5005 RepID=A0A0D6EIL7_SPOSA|nr:SPOSA6832_01438 [Sporobolomyces salmonicolor]
MPSVVPSWEAIVAKKQADQQAAIAKLGWPEVDVSPKVLNVKSVPLVGALSAEEIEITDQSVGTLLAKLASGEWKAEQVVGSFCRRAIIAHKLTNCLTETFFDKALARARALDEEFAKTGKPTGPLHICWMGWPSCQDERRGRRLPPQAGCRHLRPHQRSPGPSFARHTAPSDEADPRSPQSLMSGETVNNLYGRTVNPHNRALTCGGSSGGEGALVAMKGSPIGIGSDIGGSIRYVVCALFPAGLSLTLAYAPAIPRSMPSAFCGIYGFRPSYNRVPYGGSSNSLEGFEAVPSVLGPMSTSLDGLKTFFKAVIDAEPWRADPLALHMPWNESAYQLAEHGGGKEPLCFGFMWDDGEVRLYFADGNVEIQKQCDLSGEPNLSKLLAATTEPPHLSTYEYWQLCLERRNFVRDQLVAWEATKELTGTGRPIDGLIVPPAPYPAFCHGDSQYIYYTGLGNINDYPTSVFPVTKVDPAVDVQAAPHEFRHPFDKENYERYEPEVLRDAPIGLQCMGRKGEDEAILKMTEICAQALAALAPQA